MVGLAAAHVATRTLVLRPVGHPGFSFEPGQFAWLNMGRTPFHLEQHPISMSSGGDVARVWVDGPYGVFSPDREEGPGYVLIGGGIGVVPPTAARPSLP